MKYFAVELRCPVVFLSHSLDNWYLVSVLADSGFSGDQLW